MSSVLRVGLLGPLTIAEGHTPERTLPSSQQRRLLSILAIEAGCLVTADRLCELLACSEGSLRTLVSRLRANIGDEHLHTIAPGYLLVASTDTAEFSEAIDAATRADGVDALDLLDRAIALWRGPVVEEFRDERWAVPEVERLIEMHATAIELRAERLLSIGNAAKAAAEMHSHVVVHPLRERPRALLMRALVASGRPTEALREFQLFRNHLIDETGTEPSAALIGLENAIATGHTDTVDGAVTRPLVQRSHTSTLPAQRTSLHGREELVSRVRTLIAEHRLVSLLGPGGIGKTRLAIAAASLSLPEFDGGSYFVDLTRAAGGDVLLEVLRGLDATERPGQTSGDAVAEFLAERNALVVMDNCEHVIEKAAEVIDDLLVAAPGCRVLATSREPLRLHGERRLLVPSLPVDGPSSPSVLLFEDRAASLDDTRPWAGSRASVEAIVRHLDGIPLAIELAAAQTPRLTAERILELIDERFALLTQDLRRVPERHRTLEATIDWSYALLDPADRARFDRLSEPVGAFSVRTAARLLGLHEKAAGDLLGELCERSLLVEVLSDNRPLGYRLLETLREYGRARLADSDSVHDATAALEAALLPSPGEIDDWTYLVNRYLCAAEPPMLIEDTTRLAVAKQALEAGRLDNAALIHASVAYRDDTGALTARLGLVSTITERRDELSPTSWLAANAARLLLERGSRDYGACLTTAGKVLGCLPEDHPARSWFHLWECALTTAVDPRTGVALIETALPTARRLAQPPLDWTLSQFLGSKATGLALLQDLDEADRVAAEAIAWAPIGQESRDQALALQVWLRYLRGEQVPIEVSEEIAAQPRDLGLAELCAAPAALCASGTIAERGAGLVASAQRRPDLDLPSPFLLAFAWLAIERGDIDRAERLVRNAELYDASTHVALTHAMAAIEGWSPLDWDVRRDAMVERYLSEEQQVLAASGATVLLAELSAWSNDGETHVP